MPPEDIATMDLVATLPLIGDPHRGPRIWRTQIAGLVHYVGFDPGSTQVVPRIFQSFGEALHWAVNQNGWGLTVSPTP